jgi:hypothetical protein
VIDSVVDSAQMEMEIWKAISQPSWVEYVGYVAS